MVQVAQVAQAVQVVNVVQVVHVATRVLVVQVVFGQACKICVSILPPFEKSKISKIDAYVLGRISDLFGPVTVRRLLLLLLRLRLRQLLLLLLITTGTTHYYYYYCYCYY